MTHKNEWSHMNSLNEGHEYVKHVPHIDEGNGDKPLTRQDRPAGCRVAGSLEA